MRPNLEREAASTSTAQEGPLLQQNSGRCYSKTIQAAPTEKQFRPLPQQNNSGRSHRKTIQAAPTEKIQFRPLPQQNNSGRRLEESKISTLAYENRMNENVRGEGLLYRFRLG
jgi:hypothetical protein